MTCTAEIVNDYYRSKIDTGQLQLTGIFFILPPRRVVGWLKDKKKETRLTGDPKGRIVFSPTSVKGLLNKACNIEAQSVSPSEKISIRTIRPGRGFHLFCSPCSESSSRQLPRLETLTFS